MEIQTFKLSVKGNAAKHQDILDFSIRFIRDIDGEIFELFKLNGKPQMNVQGNIPLTYLERKENLKSYALFYALNR